MALKDSNEPFMVKKAFLDFRSGFMKIQRSMRNYKESKESQMAFIKKLILREKNNMPGIFNKFRDPALKRLAMLIQSLLPEIIDKQIVSFYEAC
jgi:hypothetical protein